MAAHFGPKSKTKLYAVVTEEHRYGHSTILATRTYNNLACATRDANADAKRYDGLTFTVVELVPVVQAPI